MGWDGKVHVKPSAMDAVYTDLSLWDVHRTDFPLLLLHDPKRMEDISNSVYLSIIYFINLSKKISFTNSF